MEAMTLGITLLAILIVLFLGLFIYALSLRREYLAKVHWKKNPMVLSIPMWRSIIFFIIRGIVSDRQPKKDPPFNQLPYTVDIVGLPPLGEQDSKRRDMDVS